MELEKLLGLIYSLPLYSLTLYCVFAALIFCALYRCCAERRWLKPCLWLMLLVWFALVLRLTLLGRDMGEHYEALWIPFSSYWMQFSGEEPESLRSGFMNAVLFYPAGLLCGSLSRQSLRSRRGLLRTVLLFMLFSLTIELTQYRLQCGFCEIDDVLHNTLGAGMGFAAFCVFEKNTDMQPTI